MFKLGRKNSKVVDVLSIFERLSYTKTNALVFVASDGLEIEEDGVNIIVKNKDNLLSLLSIDENIFNKKQENILLLCEEVSDLNDVFGMLNISGFSNISIYVNNTHSLGRVNTIPFLRERHFNISILEDGAALLDNNDKVLKLQKQVSELESSIHYYHYSLSWKLTKPLRYLNSKVRNKPSIKEVIKRTPFVVGLYRSCINRVRKFERTILDKTISEQNIKYTNAISSTRFNFSQREDRLSMADVLNYPITDFPYVNISVVTYNNGKWIDGFFKSLVTQNYPLNKLKLYFIDNSSTDDTFQILNDYKSKFEKQFSEIVVAKSENKGFGHGHDQAIQKMDGKYVLISNIDLEFQEDTISNLMKFVLTDIDNSEVASYEVVQHPYEHPKYYDPITLETAWCSHACVLLNLEMYKKVGGYHNKIFMYGEDVELSYRFRAYGYKLKYIPIAVVNHYTYDEINKVKPLQFLGSTKANMLLRISYGNKIDKLYGYFLQLALIIRGGVIDNSRVKLLKNFLIILKDRSYFNGVKKQENTYFPFRGFDYEMARKGAFYDLIKERVSPMDSQPLVSIITRTYKGRERFLTECISSVMNQTYPNIEHIIVEDGGDSMASLIHEMKKNHPNNNIRHIPLPKKGRSYIGNKGVSNAKGKYCLFLDDDDLIFPDHIDVLLNCMLKNNEVKAAYSLAWEVLTTINNDGSYYEHEYRFNDVFEQEFDRDVLMRYNYIPIQSILFDKELFDKYGGFEEDMDQLEDWNLWTKYALVSNFKFVNKLTSLYRTPYDINIRNERAAKLDAAYQTALNRQKLLIQKFGINK